MSYKYQSIKEKMKYRNKFRKQYKTEDVDLYIYLCIYHLFVVNILEEYSYKEPEEEENYRTTSNKQKRRQ